MCDAASFKRINTARLRVTNYVTDLVRKISHESPLDCAGDTTVRMVGLRVRRLKVTQSCFNELC